MGLLTVLTPDLVAMVMMMTMVRPLVVTAQTLAAVTVVKLEMDRFVLSLSAAMQ